MECKIKIVEQFISDFSVLSCFVLHIIFKNLFGVKGMFFFEFTKDMNKNIRSYILIVEKNKNKLVLQ